MLDSTHSAPNSVSLSLYFLSNVQLIPQIHRTRHRLLKELAHAVGDKHVTRAMLILLESGFIYASLCVRSTFDFHRIAAFTSALTEYLHCALGHDWPRGACCPQIARSAAHGTRTRRRIEAKQPTEYILQTLYPTSIIVLVHLCTSRISEHNRTFSMEELSFAFPEHTEDKEMSNKRDLTEDNNAHEIAEI
jgi:hypothetical protein